MKLILSVVLLSVAFAVTSAALTCMGDEEKCEEDECCVQFGPVGMCKKLLKEDEMCEMKPIKHLIKKHVYKVRCPCSDGMKCESSKDGIIGKIVGKCQKESDENGEDTSKEEVPETEE